VELSTRRMTTLDEVRALMEGSEPVDYRPLERSAVYQFVQTTLSRFRYRHLRKRDKGVIRAFLVKSTGLSLARVERPIRQHRDTGRVRDRRITNSGRPFAKVHLAADIRLLAEVDAACGQMSGSATAEILRRRFALFKDARFARLSSISSSHIYNRRVAGLLAKPRIELTRSRARRRNDNALVEGGNGHVARKHLGHDHIPRHHAPPVNEFTLNHLSPFLNHHRPCLFPVERRSAPGRTKRQYPRDRVTTPHEAFKGLDDAQARLKPGLSFEKLDRIAYAQTDMEAAMRRLRHMYVREALSPKLRGDEGIV